MPKTSSGTGIRRLPLSSSAETKPSKSITYEELYKIVARLAGSLRAQGVTKKDRVVAYMPNMTETAIAMLATTSIGATWASCGSELGMQAVIDRFSQIAPKVLFAVDGYLYKNKPFPMLPDVKAVVEAVPSIEKVVIVPYVNENPDVEQYTQRGTLPGFPVQKTKRSCSSRCLRTTPFTSCSLPARRASPNAWSRASAAYCSTS